CARLLQTRSALPTLYGVTDRTLPASASPLPVVIDTDPGIDDLLALLLALGSPELDVRGISVSYGNTVVENAYRNAVEITRRAGRRITLCVGARRPLKRDLAVAAETHGASGLGYAGLPPWAAPRRAEPNAPRVFDGSQQDGGGVGRGNAPAGVSPAPDSPARGLRREGAGAGGGIGKRRGGGEGDGGGGGGTSGGVPG